MREWEKATWASGQTEAEVIRRVGQCVAQSALQLTQAGERILILAGKGNNGADARCALEHLADRRVEVMEVTEPEADLPALKASLAHRPALLIDGLFGIGLNRPLDAAWVALIEYVNHARTQVLAVDIPSGLNGDTGEPMGAAIQATLTLTVGAPKEGLLKPATGRFVGRLEVAKDVGLAEYHLSSELQWTWPSEDFLDFPPRRLVETHKGSYGHLAIVAGSLGYHGAAVLAARGAQRAQPGLITLHTLESVYHSVAPQLAAVMVSPWQTASKLAGEHTAILIGPGLAARDIPDQMKMLMRHLWRDSLLPVVVDASALDWLPLDPVPRNAIRVITPHPGEAARLLRATPQQVQANRLEALRNVSRRFGNTWVVLKGHQTLVGRSSGEVYANPSGNPRLAQGGSGDLLSGYLAGLLTQPALQVDVLKTIRYAVWQHGAAADHLSATRPNWVVEDLAAELGTVDSRVFPESLQQLFSNLNGVQGRAFEQLIA
jgi:NAD(P)H-hydrate epimerase